MSDAYCCYPCVLSIHFTYTKGQYTCTYVPHCVVSIPVRSLCNESYLVCVVERSDLLLKVSQLLFHLL